MFNEIIINMPTNIGDSVMSLPVIDKLHANNPQANITLICSKQTIEYLSRHNLVTKTILFDKRWKMAEKIKFAFSLRGKYDLLIDLKNSALPLIINAKHTSFFRNFSKDYHSKDKYLSLIEKIAPLKSTSIADFSISNIEKNKWDSRNLPQSIFIACASNALQKRYSYKCLKQTIENLKDFGKMIILGQESDRQFYNEILSMDNVIDLVGKTKIHEVFYLIKNYARLLLCVDSSILHIASYLNKPIVALFGQASVIEYGPWSQKFMTVTRRDLDCIPCQKPHCRFNHECMDIKPEDVTQAVKLLLEG